MHIVVGVKEELEWDEEEMKSGVLYTWTSAYSSEHGHGTCSLQPRSGFLVLSLFFPIISLLSSKICFQKYLYSMFKVKRHVHRSRSWNGAHRDRSEHIPVGCSKFMSQGHIGRKCSMYIQGIQFFMTWIDLIGLLYGRLNTWVWCMLRTLSCLVELRTVPRFIAEYVPVCIFWTNNALSILFIESLNNLEPYFVQEDKLNPGRLQLSHMVV